MENQIVCLEQLRLTKWQAVWIKDFELLSLDRIDGDAIEKAELSGGDLEQVEKLKNATNAKKHLISYEMIKLQMEIQLLDAVIVELQKQFEEMPKPAPRPRPEPNQGQTIRRP